MTTGDKLSALRKENHYTQEQLAELLGVSRQAISKWEAGAAYPETEKLIRLSELYGCSLDYLLKDSVTEKNGAQESCTCDGNFFFRRRFHFKEKKSEKCLWGLPLWHIGKNARGIVACGVNARGVIAVGLHARGFFSAGLLSFGVLSLGGLSFGLLSIGSLAVGLSSAGCISAGLISAGAISLGVVSVGAVAVGDFAAGAVALGNHIAIGDHARAAIALGGTKAVGSVYEKVGELTAKDLSDVKLLLDATVPACLEWAKKLIGFFLV